MSEYKDTIQNNEYISQDEQNDEIDNELDEDYLEGEGDDGEEVEIYDEDIIYSCIGLDEDGNPNAAFSVELGLFDSKAQNLTVQTTHAYLNPQINITRTGDIYMIDFVFENAIDPDLRMIWGLLSKYKVDIDAAIRKNTPVVPMLRIQLVPSEFMGRFSVVCVAPLFWALQPAAPSLPVNTITIAFSSDAVLVHETDEIDFEGLEAEMEREEAQKEYYEDLAEQRKAEKEAYMAERNAKIEEARRSHY